MNKKHRFYIGQQVLCVDDIGSGSGSVSPRNNGLREGKIYEVSSLGNGHCNPTIGVGIKKTRIKTRCKCGAVYDNNSRDIQFSEYRFVPVVSQKSEVEISDSLKKQAHEMIELNETLSPILEPINN